MAEMQASVPLSSVQTSLRIHEIPKIMERFFSLHIENKELSTTLVRRSFKLYIEQFDPEKAYLLESEVLPYLNMSDKKAAEILARLKKNDYSDFVALNQLIQRSVTRAQEIRKVLSAQLASDELDFENGPIAPQSQYPSSEEDLMGRQKSRMARFYLFHKVRTRLDSTDRKSKVFSLFEKKVRRTEYNYLFLTNAGQPMAADRIEHLMALRIVKSFATA